MSTQHTSQPEKETSTSRSRRGDGRWPRRGRTVLIVLGAVVAVVLAFPVIANAAMTTFAAHDHGTFDIIIDGETVDLDQSRFHDLHPAFHIHPGHGNRWHHHPQTPAHIFSFEAMTLREALTAIGFEFGVATSTFDGSVYDTTHPAVTVAVDVNGAEVDLDAHVIADEDHITVQITTGP